METPEKKFVKWCGRCHKLWTDHHEVDLGVGWTVPLCDDEYERWRQGRQVFTHVKKP